MFINPTQETLDLMRKSLTPDALKKGVTISSGLTAYDLQAPAKNLYPIITPLRNKIPRVRRKNPGDAAHWKQVDNITGSGWNSMGWVPEGQRSGTMSISTANKSATYVTLGEEDFLTFEAEAAAEGFEDENAMTTLRILQKLMRKEEIGLLGGNATLTLAQPTTPTVSSSGTGSTLPTATYYVGVVVLTLEGWKNSSVTGGVATSKTITGADGLTFVLNGGSSVLSSESTGQSVTLGAPLLASTPAVLGAVAYAWFVGTTSGAKRLQAITTINSVAISAPLSSTTQLESAITTDCSKNANLAFDGLMTQAYNASNSYIQSLATGTAGTGTTLTSSGRGSVVEIDNMLQSMWDNYRISPTVLYVNAQELRNITNKVFAGSGNSSLLRYNSAAEAGSAYQITAGGTIDFYFNPFGGAGAEKGNTAGGTKMPILVHPDVPPGTIIAYAEQLPAWYQSNEVPNVAEVLTRRDYYRMDWPVQTRKRQYGVYAEEVLAVYATFGLGILTNIANG